MEPAVGFSSATRSFDTVDLPQPDSPTRPTVSPRHRVMFTPSTARTWPIVRLNTTPCVSGKCFFRSCSSSSVSPSGPRAVALPGAPARGDAAGAPRGSDDSGTEYLLAVVARCLAAGGDQTQWRE